MAKKAELPKSPIDLLFVVTNSDAVEKLNEILNRYKLNNNLAIFANGTVDSEIVDLFGFGILNRMLTTSIIQTSKSQELLKNISDELGFETEEGKGIAFTVPINSIEKYGLNILNIKWGK